MSGWTESDLALVVWDSVFCIACWWFNISWSCSLAREYQTLRHSKRVKSCQGGAGRLLSWGKASQQILQARVARSRPSALSSSIFTLLPSHQLIFMAASIICSRQDLCAKNIKDIPISNWKEVKTCRREGWVRWWTLRRQRRTELVLNEIARERD